MYKLLSICLVLFTISFSALANEDATPSMAERSVVLKILNTTETSTTEQSAYKELIKLQLENQDKRLDAQDKRIADMNISATQNGNLIAGVGNNINIFGILITALFAIAGVIGYVTFKNIIQDKTKKIFDEEGEKHLEELKTEFRGKYKELETELKEKFNQAMAVFEEKKNEVNETAAESKKIIKEYTKDFTKPDQFTEKQKTIIEAELEKVNKKADADKTVDNWQLLAIDKYNKNDFKDAIIYLDKIINISSASDEQVAKAMFNKGVTLGKIEDNLEGWKKAVQQYDNLINKYGEREEAGIVEQVARAMCNKGVRLGKIEDNLEGWKKEVQQYDSLINKYGEREETGIVEQVARAMCNKGVRLGKIEDNLEDWKKEVQQYDNLIKKYSNRDEAGIVEQVARAMFNKGITLGKIEDNLEGWKNV